jgi:hypothetical protein
VGTVAPGAEARLLPRRKAKLAPRVCANPECDPIERFQPSRRDQIYCCERCRDRAKYLKARAHLRVVSR